MKTLNLILISALVIVSFSCTSNDKVISADNLTWLSLVAVNNPPSLQLMEMTTGKVINNDVYYTGNSKSLVSAPNKIVKYEVDEKLTAITHKIYYFLFFTQDKKIEILDSSYKSLQVLDFGSKEPTDICIPNKTSAYISFGNDSTIQIFDLLYFKLAQNISVGKFPTSIASNASDNQIFVTNSGDNTVSVVNTRSNSVEQVISVAPVPVYAHLYIDGHKVVVISLGSGKIDANPKSAAVVSIIDTNTRKVIATQDIGYGNSIKAIDQIPLGFTNTSIIYSYIITKDYLFRYNTRTGTSISKINIAGNFQMITFNDKRNEVVILRTNKNGTKELLTVDPTYSTVNLLRTLPSGTLAVLPL